jgi:Arc/MetJ-type ribon-helix-helix transcriptional regulator
VNDFNNGRSLENALVILSITQYNQDNEVDMRSTKVIAFSVPPEFEHQIQKHAKAEHRTISEYIREAVRQYMVAREFEDTRAKVSKRLKKKGLKPSDVEATLAEMRKGA